MSILIGKGDGTFSSPSNFVSGAWPISVIAADFDKDGRLDLVVANAWGNNISLLFGNGDGNFSAPSKFATGATPASVFAADFDGDQNLDLVTANSEGDDVSILLGNGEGVFSSPVNFVSGTRPISAISADFDGDGDLDLATANRDGGSVSVLLGDGNGAFSPPMNFVAGKGPTSIIAADFDGDGDLDLATANFMGNDVSVLEGNGEGTFVARAWSWGSGRSTESVTVADFDKDGDLDLATANEGADSVSIISRVGGLLSASRRGNVDTGSGGPAVDTIFLDGSAGNPDDRSLSVPANSERVISVVRPPGGGAGHYGVWVYDGEPCIGDETEIQYSPRGGTVFDLGVGCRCLPSNNTASVGSCPCPVTFPVGRTSYPFGASRASLLCLNKKPGYPRLPVQFTQVFPVGTFTIGALVSDRNSPNLKPISIANWIIVTAQ